MLVFIRSQPGIAASVLGLATHFVFNRWQPRSPFFPALYTIVGAPVLLLIVAGNFSISSLVTAYAAYVGTLCLSIVLYRLSPFHPLAQFPGPALRKVTKLTSVQSTFSGRHHLIVKELHNRYGPIVRTGPDELSIVDADSITTVLGASGLPKGEYYEGRKDPNAPGNLLALVGEAHANRRRLWNRGMSSESLQGYEAMIAKRAGQLVERFEEMAGKPLDLGKWIGYFTFDFMGDMAFGGGFEMLQEGDVAGFWAMITEFTRLSATLCHIPWLSSALRKLPRAAKRLQNMRQTGIAYATARIQRGADVKDLWYHLSDEGGFEKEKPPTREVIADGVLAIIAGSDTTVSAMSALFYLLLCHPDCYRLAQEEVDRVYPSGEDALDVSKHDQLKYLSACLNEALRLHPPVPTNGPRQIPSGTAGKMIAGHFIPAGTQIYLPPYSHHRDPRYWPRSPNAFLPDRWLDPTEDHNAAAFFPFSYGPANCVGRNLARREMLMVASLLLQRFEMRFADGFEWEKWPETLHDYLVSARGPLMVTVKMR